MKTIFLRFLAGNLILIVFSHTLLASDRLIPQSMVVITTIDKPLQYQAHTQQIIQSTQGQFSVYTLNAVNDFESTVSRGLPANEVMAKRLFQQRLANIGKENFKQQLLTAYQALLTAARYQINRYPAIILNNQFVIYGVTDLKQALQQYDQWKIQQSVSKPDQGVSP